MIIIVRALLSVSIVSICGVLIDLSPRPYVGLSVCLLVWKVYCGKMAEWIRMPYGMSVLDRSGDCRRGRGSFGLI